MDEGGDGADKEGFVEAECECIAVVDDVGIVFCLSFFQRFELACAGEADADGGGRDVEKCLNGGFDETLFNLL